MQIYENFFIYIKILKKYAKVLHIIFLPDLAFFKKERIPIMPIKKLIINEIKNSIIFSCFLIEKKEEILFSSFYIAVIVLLIRRILRVPVGPALSPIGCSHSTLKGNLSKKWVA